MKINYSVITMLLFLFENDLKRRFFYLNFIVIHKSQWVAAPPSAKFQNQLSWTSLPLLHKPNKMLPPRPRPPRPPRPSKLKNQNLCTSPLLVSPSSIFSEKTQRSPVDLTPLTLGPGETTQTRPTSLVGYGAALLSPLQRPEQQGSNDGNSMSGTPEQLKRKTTEGLEVCQSFRPTSGEKTGHGALKSLCLTGKHCKV